MSENVEPIPKYYEEARVSYEELYNNMEPTLDVDGWVIKTYEMIFEDIFQEEWDAMSDTRKIFVVFRTMDRLKIREVFAENNGYRNYIRTYNYAREAGLSKAEIEEQYGKLIYKRHFQNH